MFTNFGEKKKIVLNVMFQNSFYESEENCKDRLFAKHAFPAGIIEKFYWHKTDDVFNLRMVFTVSGNVKR